MPSNLYYIALFLTMKITEHGESPLYPLAVILSEKVKQQEGGGGQIKFPQHGFRHWQLN